MSALAWIMTVIACLAYLAVGVFTAVLFTEFDGAPSHRLARAGLRIALIFFWLPLIPLCYLAALIGWIFS